MFDEEGNTLELLAFPPYMRINPMDVESPVEEDFYLFFEKYAHYDTCLQCQVKTPTHLGTFRIDFVATSPTGRKVAFEIDGARWHKDWFRDYVRDAAIMLQGGIDTMYRIPAFGVYYSTHHVFHLIQKQDPDLFSDGADLSIANRMESERFRSPEECFEGPGLYWSNVSHHRYAPSISYVDSDGDEVAALNLTRDEMGGSDNQVWKGIARALLRRRFDSLAHAVESLRGKV
jgi:very-short-patch-repair endonuclease